MLLKTKLLNLKKKFLKKDYQKNVTLDITDITDSLSRRIRVSTRDIYKESKVIPRGLGTKVKLK